MFDQETSRIFSGKQIHPFFSYCKASKKNREAIEVDGDSSFIGSKDKENTCGPIHVFERTQVRFLWIIHVHIV